MDYSKAMLQEIIRRLEIKLRNAHIDSHQMYLSITHDINKIKSSGKNNGNEVNGRTRNKLHHEILNTEEKIMDTRIIARKKMAKDTHEGRNIWKHIAKIKSTNPFDQKANSNEDESEEKIVDHNDDGLDLISDDGHQLILELPFEVLYGKKEELYGGVDYGALWNYGNTQVNKEFSWVEFSSKKNETNIEDDERLGNLNEQQAYSVVERLLQVKQFGDSNSLTTDEVDKFRYWRLFGHNKVLRRAWEKDSALGYKAPHERNLVMV